MSMDSVEPSKSKQRELLKCPDCDRVFLKEVRLKEHSYTHTGIKPFACHWEGCDARYTRQYQLLRHIRSHTGEKPYECTIPGCDKAFTSTNALKRHIYQHEVPKPFVCEFEGCGEKFSQHIKLLRHQCIHTGVNPYPCTYEGCDKSFKHPFQLKRHIDAAHEFVLSHICGFEGCEERFRTHKELQDHVKQCHPQTKFTCTLCNKTFMTRRILLEHNKTHNIHRRMWKCEHCGKDFTKKCNLKVHIQVTHLGEKPHVCPYEDCGEAFAYKKMLVKHLKTHTQDSEVLEKKLQPNKKRKKVTENLLGINHFFSLPPPDDSTSTNSIKV